MRKRTLSLGNLAPSVVLGLFALFCVVPILAIVAISMTPESSIVANGYRLIPPEIDFNAFRYIFRNPKQILNAYGVSITVTLVGAVVGLLCNSMFAYAISRPDFSLRRPFTFLILFTMLFNGGLVPTYMVITNVLHLKNTLWALILPYLANAWYIILLRSYFSNIPLSIVESAKIDGASEARVLFSIVYPISLPALATVGLFITLNYWNDWWLAMLYIEKQALIPLQYLLARMMRDLSELLQSITEMPAGMTMRDFPNESARMAMCLLAAGPMLFVFPFFQKYFVKGLTVGAIKE